MIPLPRLCLYRDIPRVLESWDVQLREIWQSRSRYLEFFRIGCGIRGILTWIASSNENNSFVKCHSTRWSSDELWSWHDCNLCSRSLYTISLLTWLNTCRAVLQISRTKQIAWCYVKWHDITFHQTRSSFEPSNRRSDVSFASSSDALVYIVPYIHHDYFHQSLHNLMSEKIGDTDARACWDGTSSSMLAKLTCSKVPGDEPIMTFLNLPLYFLTVSVSGYIECSRNHLRYLLFKIKRTRCLLPQVLVGYRTNII